MAVRKLLLQVTSPRHAFAYQLLFLLRNHFGIHHLRRRCNGSSLGGGDDDNSSSTGLLGATVTTDGGTSDEFVDAANCLLEASREGIVMDEFPRDERPDHPRDDDPRDRMRFDVAPRVRPRGLPRDCPRFFGDARGRSRTDDPREGPYDDV